MNEIAAKVDKYFDEVPEPLKNEFTLGKILLTTRLIFI